MRRSVRARHLVAAAVVAIGLAGAVAFVRGTVPCDVLQTQPACYLAIGPGPVVDTFRAVTISGAEVDEVDGALLVTTIVVTDGLSIGDWWSAMTSPTIETARRDTLFPPGRDPDEVRRRNEVAMADSQLEATIAALDLLGHDLEADGARIAVVLADAVTDALAVDDVVTAVDAEAITSSTQLSDEIGRRAPGTTVVLTVRRGSQTLEVEVVLGAAEDDPNRGRIGVLAITEIALPVEVTIDAGSVGGPSAGMMFALAIVDLLSEGSLTDGRVIAGTGAVSRDGTVRAVGGVRQKLPAATLRDPAADVFLVPRANLGDARRAVVAADIVVVPIDDLAHAVEVLTTLAEGRRPAGALTLVPG